MAKHMSKIAWFCILLIGSPLLASGRLFPVMHYTTAQGLPSNKAYQVYCDSKGFVWIGTDKGAARYNGISFERFTTVEGLPDNEIFSFREDKEGRLWIGSYGGALCYYKDQVFHTAENTPFLRLPDRISFTNRISVAEDSSVIILFKNHRQFIVIKKNEIKRYGLDGTSDSAGICELQGVRKAKGGGYGLLYNNKVVDMDSDGRIRGSRPYAQGSQYLYATSEDKEYLVNNTGIYTLDERLLFPIKKLLPNNGYTVAGAGDVQVLCTTRGLFINDSLWLFKGVQITSYCRDPEGNFWFSTLLNGVYCLGRDFLRTKEYGNSYSSNVKYVRPGHALSFMTDDNKVYRLEGDSIRFCRTASYPERYCWKSDYEAGTADKEIRGGSYLKAAKARNDKIRLLSLLHAQDIFYDDSCVYGRWGSDMVYVPYKGKAPVSNRGVASLFALPLVGSNIYCTARDTNNVTWFSTAEGLYYISGRKVHAPPWGRGLSFRAFVCHKGYLIGYTAVNDLLIVQRQGALCKIDTLKHQNCIWDQLYALPDGRLLIGTNNQYRALTFSGDTVTLDIIENRFLPRHATRIWGDSAYLYFFGNGTVSRFPASVIDMPIKPPLVFFTTLKTADSTYYANGEITLSYLDAKNIRLGFRGQSFGSEEVLYAYALATEQEPVATWNPVKEEINLSTLAPGRYTIKVRASNLSGAAGAEAVLRLTLLKPYWQKWWFVLLASLLGIGMIAYGIRRAIARKFKQRQRQLEARIKFQQSEFKALNALMNPHFIFNSLNNIQQLIHSDDRDAADRYLLIFSKLVRQNMQNISKGLVPLHKELELVDNYLQLERLRFRDRVGFRIEIDEAALETDLLMPPLLIQPLVENAVKHGLLALRSSRGLVVVRVYEQRGVMYIEVTDNGPGLCAEAQAPDGGLHESLGLKNVRQRIDHMCAVYNRKADFQIYSVMADDGTVTGTKATLSFGLSDNDP